MVPGWPGLGHIYSIEESFINLEKDFALVYWNLRGAGTSRGTPPSDSITIAQMEEDLDLLIETLLMKYDHSSIFLAAHSFGANLTGNYLTERLLRREVAGFISIDGNLDRIHMHERMRTEVLDYAAQRTDNPYWKEAYDYCLEPPVPPADYNPVYDYADTADIISMQNDLQKMYLDIMLKSFTQKYGNTELIATQLGGYDSVFSGPFSQRVEQLDTIDLPVLLLHGKYENTGLGRENAEHLLSQFSTPVENKGYVMFEESGHFPYRTEPEKFSQSIRDFINKIQGRI